MHRKKITSILLSLLLLAAGCDDPAKKRDDRIPPEITMDKEELLNKIKGGWAGKTIGCTYGGPVEFIFNGTMIQEYTPITWSDSHIEHYFNTFPGLFDDIYVNITFMEVFDRLGLIAPADSFAIAFANKSFPLWHANQAAKYNISRGIMPPQSGHWLNNPHADDIDYQIESDFAGLMCPAMPNTASAISDKIGHIFNYGDGWYGGVFTGAMYSLAFVYDNPVQIVEEALKTIPEKSDFYQCVNTVIKCFYKNPTDWRDAWFEIEKRWSAEVGCPDGVFAPLNIDAKINSAYVAIGLLYGKSDFFETMDIATRCGQDSDCNAATAAGVLGTMIGYEKIPQKWTVALDRIVDRDFEYTNTSFNELYEKGLRHALMVIESEGGRRDKNQITIKTQIPQPVRYEKSFEGHYPVAMLEINHQLKDSFEYTFNGIGIVFRGHVTGPDLSYEAEVEMYIDGELVETAILPGAAPGAVDKRRTDLFWKYQLTKNRHEVRFKWLNPNDKTTIYFSKALIYSDLNS